MMENAVLLVSHGFQPSYEKAFANALSRCGLDVTLAASVRTEFDRLDPAINVVNLLPSMDPGRSIAQKVIAKIRYVYDLFGQAFRQRHGAIHLIGTFLTTSIPLGVFELLFYRAISHRLLLTVHNLLPHDRHTSLNFRAAWLAYRIPHVLVVHTEKMRDGLVRHWGIAANKIVVMEHGVDEIPETSAAWRPDEKGRLRLLMFGGISKYKGIDIALEALRELHDFSVVLKIVGVCRDSAYEKELRGLIALIPYLHRIEWIGGYVPEKDVQAYFEDADAVLLPYRHIDQSGVLFTAYRFGVPVLAFDVGSFAQYVVPGTGIVIKEQSASCLRASISVFRGTLAHYDRTNIKEYAKRYLWENTVRPLLCEYH